MCKLCEHKVQTAWSGLMSMKNVSNPNLKFSHFVVNKMLNFVSNLIYFLTADVIQPHWAAFWNEIPNSQSLDEILLLHRQMLDKILADSLCTVPELLKELIKALNSVNEFCVMLNKFTDMMTLETVDLDMGGKEMNKKE